MIELAFAVLGPVCYGSRVRESVLLRFLSDNKIGGGGGEPTPYPVQTYI